MHRNLPYLYFICIFLPQRFCLSHWFICLLVDLKSWYLFIVYSDVVHGIIWLNIICNVFTFLWIFFSFLRSRLPFLMKLLLFTYFLQMWFSLISWSLFLFFNIRVRNKSICIHRKRRSTITSIIQSWVALVMRNLFFNHSWILRISLMLLVKAF